MVDVSDDDFDKLTPATQANMVETRSRIPVRESE